jgi:hypothetical protein
MLYAQRGLIRALGRKTECCGVLLMDYDEIAKLIEPLGYRDKLRLAQLLIQFARKEEEGSHPEKRQSPNAISQDTIDYVYERLLKLRPTRRPALLNSIGAMYQFQGGISDKDKERIVKELQRQNKVLVEENGHITYPE